LLADRLEQILLADEAKFYQMRPDKTSLGRLCFISARELIGTLEREGAGGPPRARPTGVAT
jgi:hypothetical protein